MRDFPERECSTANTSQLSGIIPDDVNTQRHNTNKKNVSHPVALIGRANVAKLVLEGVEDDIANFSTRVIPRSLRERNLYMILHY
jgi:hypothetical protein